MAEPDISPHKRFLPVMSIQGAFAQLGWILGSPSIVLTYLAVANELPVFLAAVLPTTRRAGNMVAGAVAAKTHRLGISREVRIALSNSSIGVLIPVAFAAITWAPVQSALIILSVTIFLIGFSEEILSINYGDFVGEKLSAPNRTRLRYRVLALGGVAAAILVWPIHTFMLEYSGDFRHAALIALAMASFFVAAYLIFRFAPTDSESGSNSSVGTEKSARSKTSEANTNDSHWALVAKPWFFRFLIVRLMLLVVELSGPFFAVLAAVTHKGSTQGLCAIVISAAVAVAISGPLWRPVADRSNSLVLLLACSLAALGGLALTANQFLQFANDTAVHTFALFCFTVGSLGVIAARDLHFLEIAPQSDRMTALAISKYVVGGASVVLTIALAALAHVQHPVWAIFLISSASLVTAFVSYQMTTANSRHDCRSLRFE